MLQAKKVRFKKKRKKSHFGPRKQSQEKVRNQDLQ